jgi:ribose transport system permease protein
LSHDPAPAEADAERRIRVGESALRARTALLNYIGVLTVLVGLILFFGLKQPQFATFDNFINILETNSVLLILSVGLTFTLLVGGFDLSIGGVLALSGVLLYELLSAGVPTIPAILILVAAGVIWGATVTGLPIAALDVSFFVVTLGVLVATRGLAFVVTKGEVKGLYDEKLLRSVATGTVGKIPYDVIIAVGILVVAIVVTRYTGYGRMIYAVGGNTEAARLAGINVTAVRLSTYAISAGLAALSGCIEASRLAAASPDVDQGIEFSAAAAVLLGGTSFVGGIGTMFGTFLGVLFLGVLQNGLIIESISVYWQGVITGAVLFASVMIDRFRRGRMT